LKIIRLIPFFFILLACENTEGTEDHELVGTWLTECANFDDGRSRNEGFEITSKSMSFRETYYFDDQCSDPSSIFGLDFDFKIVSDGEQKGELDFQATSAFLTPYTSEGIEELEDFFQVELVIGEKNDMTEYYSSWPEFRVNCQIYKIEENRLFLGNDNGIHDGESCVSRPLDYADEPDDTVYILQEN
jgi:hypothetical protein